MARTFGPYGLLLLLLIVVPTTRIEAADVHRAAVDYLGALAEKDSHTLYTLEFRPQQGEATIRASKPEILWNRLLQENRQDYVSEWKADDLVAKMMALRPEFEVIEVREAAGTDVRDGRPTTKVFATLEFSAPSGSPVLVTRGSSSKMLARTAIVELTLDAATGWVKERGIVPEGLEAWSNPPLLVLSVSLHGAGRQQNEISIYPLGGIPPYQGRIKCGTLETIATDNGSYVLSAKLGVFGPGRCSAVVRDSSGGMDAVLFDLRPSRTRPSGSLGEVTALSLYDWWGREPWLSLGYRDALFGNQLAQWISVLTPFSGSAEDEESALAEKTAGATRESDDGPECRPGTATLKWSGPLRTRPAIPGGPLLSSGTNVTVLSGPRQNFCRVTHEGEEGWILSNYLTYN